MFFMRRADCYLLVPKLSHGTDSGFIYDTKVESLSIYW